MRCVELNGVSFGYSGAKSNIFDNINISINKSAITAICGRNGAGKSTLLKLIAGINKAASGSVIIDNKEIGAYHKRELALKMAYVDQNFNQDLPLKVADIINLGNYPREMIVHDNRREFNSHFRDAIDSTGVRYLLDRSYNLLSGGEKQKVMIARAVCQSSEIILLDEPTSSLDIGNKVEIKELLLKFNRQNGSTIIMVSHDLNEVAAVADYTILVDGSKILTGRTEEVLSDVNLEACFYTKINRFYENGRVVFYY